MTEALAALKSVWHELSNHAVDILIGLTAIALAALITAPFRLVSRVHKRYRAKEVQLSCGDGGSEKPTIVWGPIPKDRTAALELLWWRIRLADFVGQNLERKRLSEWIHRSPRERMRVCVLSGEGGVGKTRLAAEVASKLRRPWWSLKKSYWSTVGFVSSGASPRIRTPALLLVDYPEDSPRYVSTLLQELYRNPDLRGPIRVLLLSRHSIEKLRNRLAAVGMTHILDDHEIEVSSLGEVDALRLYRSATMRLARSFAQRAPKTTATEFNAWFESDRDMHCLPLFITAAAIYTITNSSPHPLGYSGREMLRALAHRELERLRRASIRELGFADDALSRLAACAAIRGQLDASDLRRLADPCLEMSLPPAGSIVDAVGRVAWWKNGRWDGPRPHTVAAALVYEVFNERPDMAADWFWAAAFEGVGPMIERLDRLVHDVGRVYGARGTEDVRTWLSALVSGKNWMNRASELQRLAYDNVPSNLAFLSALVTEIILESETSKAKLAKLRNNLSIRYLEAGNASAALDEIQKAVETYEDLVKTSRRQFEPGLAKSLSNLSVMLSEVDNKKALQAIERSVSIRRSLARHDPRFAGDYALSLNNLSGDLSNAGDSARALDVIEEAVAIRTRLAREGGADQQRDLAVSLENLANRLGEGGNYQRALIVSEQAMTYFRQLSERRGYPEPGLGASLDNMVLRLLAVGDFRRAATTAEQALRVFREHVQDQPTRYQESLGGSFSNASVAYSELGDYERARTYCDEALKAFGEVRRQSEQLDADVAATLNTLAATLLRLGEVQGAISTGEKAARTYRLLQKRQAGRFEADLAACLTNLSNAYGAAEDHSRSLGAAESAVQIFKKLVQNRPGRLSAELAASLNNLSISYCDSGDVQRAVAALEESVAIYRAEADKFPARFANYLTASRANLADVLLKAGDIERARQLREEALDASRRVAHEGRMDRLASIWSNILLRYGSAARSCRNSIVGRDPDAGRETREVRAARTRRFPVLSVVQPRLATVSTVPTPPSETD